MSPGKRDFWWKWSWLHASLTGFLHPGARSSQTSDQTSPSKARAVSTAQQVTCIKLWRHDSRDCPCSLQLPIPLLLRLLPRTCVGGGGHRSLWMIILSWHTGDRSPLRFLHCIGNHLGSPAKLTSWGLQKGPGQRFHRGQKSTSQVLPSPERGPVCGERSVGPVLHVFSLVLRPFCGEEIPEQKVPP